MHQSLAADGQATDAPRRVLGHVLHARSLPCLVSWLPV
jgi:hypothetical protein